MKFHSIAMLVPALMLSGLFLTMGSACLAKGPDEPSQGVIAVSLEKIDGYFIEGFEIGLRFETLNGDVISALSWNEFIRSHENPSLDDYYNSVLEQTVPAGDVVTLATINVGIGPPPEIVDLDGEMQCRVVVVVPDNGRVAVSVSFSSTHCLSLQPR